MSLRSAADWKRHLNQTNIHRKTIIKEDHVFKKGEQSFAGWKKRYCVLWSTKIMEYFADDTLKDRKGIIDLSKLSQGCVMTSEKGYKKEEADFGFSIITKGRTWEIAVCTKSERKEWMAALRDVISSQTHIYVEYWKKWPYYNFPHARKWEIECEYILKNWCRFYYIEVKNEISRLIIKYTASITLDEFVILSQLGVGFQSQVFLVRDLISGRLHALKVKHKHQIRNDNQIIRIQRERQIWQQVMNPFVVSMHYAFQDRFNLYYVVDYYPGGELFFHLRENSKFSEQSAQMIIAQVVLAIEYLHSLDILYRSCKPEDILLDMDGYVALTDFGNSKQLAKSSSTTNTHIGPAAYKAPEVILGVSYNRSADWWSVGALLYELVHGLPPFYAKNPREMNDSILNQKLVIKPTLSSHCQDILYRLLTKDPQQRLGSDETDAEPIKRHPFFRNVNWTKLQQKKVNLPFRPREIHTEIDTCNFDKQFTQSDPMVYLEQHPANSSEGAQPYSHDIFANPDMAWDYPM